MCVAQVRAMTHMAALTVMSTNHAPGESPKVVEVKGMVSTWCAFFSLRSLTFEIPYNQCKYHFVILVDLKVRF